MKKPVFALVIVLVSLLVPPALAGGKHLAANFNFVAAVMQDGTVRAAGDNVCGQCDTQAWRDVIAVAAGYSHTLGLKKDGTVYAAGDNAYGQCDVSGWKNIVMVAASYSTSFGLTKNGAIVYTRDFDVKWQEEVKGWKDLVWIGAEDGKVFAVDRRGKAYGVGMDFGRLSNVVQITADGEGIYKFLLSDGTLKLLAPYNDYETVVDMDSPEYQGAVAIADTGAAFMVLKRDGTVASDTVSGYFADWDKIAEIDGGYGVRADGSVWTDKEFTRRMTGEQLEEIYAFNVMVDPKRAGELGADAMAKNNPALKGGCLFTAGGTRMLSQPVGFAPGSKYGVYTGPGREYLRGGEGKALVSTKEKMQVYGVDNGWVMIQYAVSENKLRFGYIPVLTLPEKYRSTSRVKPVNLLAQAETAAVLRDTAITDDPNGSGDTLALLKAGQGGVLYLGELNGTWAYVQAVNGEGVPLRGFVPLAAVSHQADPARSAYQVPGGTVQVWREGSLTARTLGTGIRYAVVPGNVAAVSVPASVTDLNDLAELDKLQRVDVSPENPAYKSADGVVFSKDGKTLLLYPRGRPDKIFAVPEGTEIITAQLQSAAALETLALPASMTGLPGTKTLSRLKNVEVSANNPAYKSLDGVVFSKDGAELIFYPPEREQEEYAIPEGTAVLGTGVFSEAVHVKTLALPSTLAELDTDDAVPALEAFSVGDNHPSFFVRDGVLFSRDGEILVRYPEAKPGDTYAVPAGVKEIGGHAFPQNAVYLKHVSLPGGLLLIGDYAFDMCETLQSVSIPDSAVYIGDGAFEGCVNLHTVRLPKNLLSIGSFAFIWSGLSGTLSVPEGVVSIGDEALCYISLSDLYLPASLKYMEMGANLIINSSGDPSSTVVHAPVGSRAAQLALEAGCVYQGGDAYALPQGKSWVFEPESQMIDGVQFSLDGKTLLSYPRNRPGDTYTVPPGTTAIGFRAFFRAPNSLRQVVLPKGLTSIGPEAFWACASLESVSLPDSLVYIGCRAFMDCENLSSVNLPQSLAVIDAAAFSGTALSGELRIPEHVAYIGGGAFAGLRFTDVYLPESLQYCEVYSTFGWWDMQPEDYTMVVHVKQGSPAEWFAHRSGFPVVKEP